MGRIKIFSENKIWLYLIIAFEFIWRLPYSTILYYLLHILLIVALIVLYRINKSYLVTFLLLFGSLPQIIMEASSSRYIFVYGLEPRVLIIMAFVPLIDQIYKQSGTLKLKKNNIALTILPIMMSLYMLISFFFTVDKSQYTLFFVYSTIIYAMGVFFVTEEKDIRLIWKSFVIFGIIFSVHIFSNIVSGDTIYTLEAIADRNFLSMYVIVAIVMTITYIIYYSSQICRMEKIILYITIFIECIIIMSFASRTAFLMLVLMSSFVVLYLFSNDLKKAIMIIVLICIVSYIFYNYGMLNSMIDRFQESTLSTGSGRTTAQAGFIKAFIEENMALKIFGRGYFVLKVNGIYAHNDFLQLLIDFGLPILIVYLSLFAISFLKLWRSKYQILVIPLTVLFINEFAINASANAVIVIFFMFMVSTSNYASNKSEIS